MNEPKYTKGPWAVTEGADYDYDALIIHEGYRPKPKGIECYDASYICHINTEGPLTDTDRANARLIASAPKLLAALKTASVIIGHPDDDISKYIKEVILEAEGK